MAMTVMAIGGAAVITMQKTSVTGNLDARRADVANAIARTWVERLQRDAMAVDAARPGEHASNNIGNALIVAQVVEQRAGSGSCRTRRWARRSPRAMSPAFDILGRDLPLACSSAARISASTSASRGSRRPRCPAGGDLIRADVRVLWPIGIINSLPGFCNADTAALADPNIDPKVVNPAGGDPNAPVFHTLYLTTTIKENTAP